VMSLGALSGCAALVVGAAAGAGAYAYSTGKLTATLDAPLEASYDAARAACKALELRERSANKDAFEGKVDASTADNSDVTIRVTKLAEKSTQVTIRVGTFGDEHKSSAILAEMRKRVE